MIARETIEKIRDLHEEGYSKSQIGRMLNLSRPTVLKYLDQNNDSTSRIKKSVKPESESPGYRDKEMKRSEDTSEYSQMTYRPATRNTFVTDEMIYLQEMEYERLINHNSEIAVEHLKNIVPGEFKQMLNVRHLLELKAKVEKEITPLIGNETEETLEELSKLIAREYYDSSLKSMIGNIVTENRKNELVEKGVDKVSWILISKNFDPEFHIDSEDKKEIEEFVRKRLEKNLTGNESSSELDKIVKFLVNKLLELN